MKGVYIVDIEYSPLWRAAQYHCESNSLVLIAATSFSSPFELVKALSEHNPDYLIISWREAFDAVLWGRRCRKVLIESNPLIFLLIPDHLGLDLYKEREVLRCEVADVILTTSIRLKQSYMDLNASFQIEVLHDMPDINLLNSRKFKNIIRRENQLIWVGNSQWGKRQGLYDHKGLHRFVKDIFANVKAEESNASLVVIDSALSALKHEYVLDNLAQSSCLIVTSDSEGTCLPILEAAALGTPVVTFDVGIAHEIFAGELKNQFIAPRNTSKASELVLKVLSDFNKASNDSKFAWEQYFQKASGDLQQLLSRDFHHSGMWRIREGNRVSRLKWYLRWLKRKILKLRKE